MAKTSRFEADSNKHFAEQSLNASKESTMKLSITREKLLKPLQLVASIVEKRQTLPILSNILLKIVDNQLSIVGTDLEVELTMHIPLINPAMDTEFTVPARKLTDICRSLPDDAMITFSPERDKVLIQSGRSRFSLTTLPANEYPCLEQTEDVLKLSIEQRNLRFLIQRTHFAMAQQDVRYYLNGLLLEVKQGIIRSVATDGHRLAMNSIEASPIDNAFSRIIIPRKGVTELMKLLDDSREEVTVSIMANHIQVSNKYFVFSSKLIDGRYPDYQRVIPRGGDKLVTLPRNALKESLTRASILSNEKLRGVELQLRKGLMRILATNPDREEAEEEISIDYDHENIDIGFNVKYLTDIFDTIDDDIITMTFSDGNSSILVEGNKGEGNSLFVVMPMRF